MIGEIQICTEIAGSQSNNVYPYYFRMTKVSLRYCWTDPMVLGPECIAKVPEVSALDRGIGVIHADVDF